MNVRKVDLHRRSGGAGDRVEVGELVERHFDYLAANLHGAGSLRDDSVDLVGDTLPSARSKATEPSGKIMLAPGIAPARYWSLRTR